MNQQEIFERHTQGEEITIVTLVTDFDGTNNSYSAVMYNSEEKVINSFFNWKSKTLMIDAATKYANNNDYFISE